MVCYVILFPFPLFSFFLSFSSFPFFFSSSPLFSYLKTPPQVWTKSHARRRMHVEYTPGLEGGGWGHYIVDAAIPYAPSV